MAKLSDTQLVILSNACQRDDRLVLPLPDRLKGGAASKVISSLIAKGLVKGNCSRPGVWRYGGSWGGGYSFPNRAASTVLASSRSKSSGSNSSPIQSICSACSGWAGSARMASNAS